MAKALIEGPMKMLIGQEVNYFGDRDADGDTSWGLISATFDGSCMRLYFRTNLYKNR